MSDTSKPLLEFPCDFPIKIMGAQNDALRDAVTVMVQHHAPDFDPATIEVRLSSGGRYVGLTCTIRATSREQLDNLYRDLSSHPLVKVVL